MATLNNAEVLVGKADVYYNATAGTAAGSITTLVGYTDGVSLALEESSNSIMSDQSNYPIKVVTSEQGGTVTLNLLQPTLANLAVFSQGATVSGGTLAFSTSTNAEIALKLVGVDSSGTARTIHIPFCRSDGGFEMAFARAEASAVEVTLKMLKDDSQTNVFTISDASSSGVTLASDTFAWVSGQSHYYMTPESGTTDDLATITAGAATSSTEIIIQPVAGSTCTVVETGNVALLATADTTYEMYGSDSMTLKYDGSDWNETSRVMIV